MSHTVDDQPTFNRRHFLIGAGGLSALALGGIAVAPASAAGLKVAAVFATPIEEPWDNQIHVARGISSADREQPPGAPRVR